MSKCGSRMMLTFDNKFLSSTSSSELFIFKRIRKESRMNFMAVAAKRANFYARRSIKFHFTYQRLLSEKLSIEWKNAAINYNLQ